MQKINSLKEIAIIIVYFLVLTIIIFILGPPLNSDFFWPDASRHAIDGVYWFDIIREKGFFHPLKYTLDYYLHSPAITPIMYPPVFPLIEAIAFSIFGISVVTTKLTIGLFYFSLLLCTYVLSRIFFNILESLLAATTLAFIPDVLFWGRQVMLELPALTFMVTGIYFLIQYERQKRQTYLWLALLFGLLAFFTKQQALIVIFIYISIICIFSGIRSLFTKQIILCALIFFLFTSFYLVLSYFLTLNFDQALGRHPVSSINNIRDALLYYPKIVPNQIGYKILLLAIIGFSLNLWRFLFKKPLYKRELFLLAVTWITFNYLFITSIRHYEQRYAFFWIPAFVLLAVSGISQIVDLIKFNTLRQLLLIMLIFFESISFIFMPASPPKYFFRKGLAQVAKCVNRHIHGPSILIHLHHDGTLIFRLRELSFNKNHYIFRALKLFAINYFGPDWGLQDQVKSINEMRKTLDGLGVNLFVIQRNFCPTSKVSIFLKKILSNETEYKKIGSYALTFHNGIFDVVDVYERLYTKNSINFDKIQLHLPSAKMPNVLINLPSSK